MIQPRSVATFACVARLISNRRIRIAQAVGALASFKEAETHRIEYLQQEALSDAQAESLILRACIQPGIIAQRQLPFVFRAWHEPPFEAWSLLNAFTGVLQELQEKQPAELAHRTMRLHALLAPKQPEVPAILDAEPALAM